MSGLAERLARSLPAASFELETLVRLVGIVENTDIDSAAVTYTHRARLLVNPEFVVKHCYRDEHLFLLVMHEMWHVLLGHTTLYDRPSKAHNIAFDALINAGLARQHPEAEYRGFFENLNPADQFPALLLRPPVGWPRKPDYKVPGPRGTRKMLQRLYPQDGDRRVEPTYQELLNLIRKAEPRQLTSAALIGSHEHDENNHSSKRNPMSDELFSDVVREIVGKWPPPPFPLTGRDQGGNLRTTWVESTSNLQQIRRELRKVLTTVLQPDRTGVENQHRNTRTVTVGPGPLPNVKDRHLPARRLLQGSSVLANQEVVLTTRSQQKPQKALVYLDVSGSMSAILPHLTDLLATPARQGLIRVKQFSTQVAPLTAAALSRGELSTTNGTDISCVLTDIASEHCQRVLIVTDGYVGKPPETLLAPLQDRHVTCTALLPADGWAKDLEEHMNIYYLSDLEAT